MWRRRKSAARRRNQYQWLLLAGVSKRRNTAAWRLAASGENRSAWRSAIRKRRISRHHKASNESFGAGWRRRLKRGKCGVSWLARRHRLAAARCRRRGVIASAYLGSGSAQPGGAHNQRRGAQLHRRSNLAKTQWREQCGMAAKAKASWQ